MDLASLTLLAHNGSSRGGGGGGARFLFLLLLFIFLLLVGKMIMRKRMGGRPGRHGHPGGGSPMRLLEERFANGEIDRAEFEHRKAVLLDEDVIPPAPQPTPAPPANSPSDLDSETPEPPESTDDE